VRLIVSQVTAIHTTGSEILSQVSTIFLHGAIVMPGVVASQHRAVTTDSAVIAMDVAHIGADTLHIAPSPIIVGLCGRRLSGQSARDTE
jgi:hypothetical protein